jgi:hypothetical protein
MHRPDPSGADSELINEVTGNIFNAHCNRLIYIFYNYRDLKLSTTRFFKTEKRISGDVMPRRRKSCCY